MRFQGINDDQGHTLRGYETAPCTSRYAFVRETAINGRLTYHIAHLVSDALKPSLERLDLGNHVREFESDNGLR